MLIIYCDKKYTATCLLSLLYIICLISCKYYWYRRWPLCRHTQFLLVKVKIKFFWLNWFHQGFFRKLDWNAYSRESLQWSTIMKTTVHRFWEATNSVDRQAIDRCMFDQWVWIAIILSLYLFNRVIFDLPEIRFLFCWYQIPNIGDYCPSWQQQDNLYDWSTMFCWIVCIWVTLEVK